ncbi:MAG: PilZ domain-containing protein [Desulfonatronovibrio sp.]
MKDFYDQLDVEYAGETQRKAYRVSIPNLEITIKDREEKFQALDISAGGVAFSFSEKENPGLEQGQEIKISLVIRSRVFLEDLRAVVVKTGDSFAACEFKDIPLRQEARLDKLVLEVQKKMIELKRRKSQEEDEEK